MCDLKKIFCCGLAFAIVAQFIHSAAAFLLMGYYTDPAYYSLWSSLMMPGGKAPGVEFLAYSLLFNFVTGLIYAYGYFLVRQSFAEKNAFHKGIKYGLLLFLLAGIPGYLSLFLLLALPPALLAAWAAESLLVFLLGGLLVAKICEERGNENESANKPARKFGKKKD